MISGKEKYTMAVMELGKYLCSISPEVAAIEAEMESLYITTGKINPALEETYFAKKAESLSELIKTLESGVKFLPAREVQ